MTWREIGRCDWNCLWLTRDVDMLADDAPSRLHYELPMRWIVSSGSLDFEDACVVDPSVRV